MLSRGTVLSILSTLNQGQKVQVLDCFFFVLFFCEQEHIFCPVLLAALDWKCSAARWAERRINHSPSFAALLPVLIAWGFSIYHISQQHSWAISASTSTAQNGAWRYPKVCYLKLKVWASTLCQSLGGFYKCEHICRTSKIYNNIIINVLNRNASASFFCLMGEICSCLWQLNVKILGTCIFFLAGQILNYKQFMENNQILFSFFLGGGWSFKLTSDFCNEL